MKLKMMLWPDHGVLLIRIKNLSLNINTMDLEVRTREGWDSLPRSAARANSRNATQEVLEASWLRSIVGRVGPTEDLEGKSASDRSSGGFWKSGSIHFS